jgi:hypothetical protein
VTFCKNVTKLGREAIDNHEDRVRDTPSNNHEDRVRGTPGKETRARGTRYTQESQDEEARHRDAFPQKGRDNLVEGIDYQSNKRGGR